MLSLRGALVFQGVLVFDEAFGVDVFPYEEVSFYTVQKWSRSAWGTPLRDGAIIREATPSEIQALRHYYGIPEHNHFENIGLIRDVLNMSNIKVYKGETAGGDDLLHEWVVIK